MGDGGTKFKDEELFSSSNGIYKYNIRVKIFYTDVSLLTRAHGRGPEKKEHCQSHQSRELVFGEVKELSEDRGWFPSIVLFSPSQQKHRAAGKDEDSRFRTALR